MSEKLEVVNFGQCDLSFDLNPLGGKLDWMASHHRRRATKGSVVSVKVPKNACVDLVNLTGHSCEVLEGCENLQDMFKSGQLKRLDDMKRESEELNKAIEEFDKVSDEDLADPDEVLVDPVEDNSDLFASDKAKAVVEEVDIPVKVIIHKTDDIVQERDLSKPVEGAFEVAEVDKDLVVVATGEVKVEIPMSLPPIIEEPVEVAEEPKEAPKPPVKRGRGRPKNADKKLAKKSAKKGKK